MHPADERQQHTWRVLRQFDEIGRAVNASFDTTDWGWNNFTPDDYDNAQEALSDLRQLFLFLERELWALTLGKEDDSA